MVGIDDFSGGYEDFVDEEVTLYNRELASDNLLVTYLKYINQTMFVTMQHMQRDCHHS